MNALKFNPVPGQITRWVLAAILTVILLLAVWEVHTTILVNVGLDHPRGFVHHAHPFSGSLWGAPYTSYADFFAGNTRNCSFVGSIGIAFVA